MSEHPRLQSRGLAVKICDNSKATLHIYDRHFIPSASSLFGRSLASRAVERRALSLPYAPHGGTAAQAGVAGAIVDEKLVLEISRLPVACHVVAQRAAARAYRELERFPDRAHE